MEHEIKYMILDWLEADRRRDLTRIEEIRRSLLNRGWHVVIERCDPPRPVREPHVPPPVPLGDRSPAEQAAFLQHRQRGYQGPGVC